MGQGFVSALTWINLLAMLGGVTLGIVKSLMSGALGLLISCIGLFFMSQVFILAEKKIVERARAKKFSDKIALSKDESKMLWPTIIRSWIIGNIIGILTGAGASIACFMDYNNAKQFTKHKEDFGHGAIEGVSGSEAANNAVTGGEVLDE